MLTRSYPRRFTFYVAHPMRSLHQNRVAGLRSRWCIYFVPSFWFATERRDSLDQLGRRSGLVASRRKVRSLLTASLGSRRTCSARSSTSRLPVSSRQAGSCRGNGSASLPRHVAFEHRGRDRDVTRHVEAVPAEHQRERHKVRVTRQASCNTRGSRPCRSPALPVWA
jgi:hypothetical protein